MTKSERKEPVVEVLSPAPEVAATRRVKLLFYHLWNGKRVVYEVIDPRQAWIVAPDDVAYTVEEQDVPVVSLATPIHIPDHVPAEPSHIRQFLLT